MFRCQPISRVIFTSTSKPLSFLLALKSISSRFTKTIHAVDEIGNPRLQWKIPWNNPYPFKDGGLLLSPKSANKKNDENVKCV
jgi:hypothetical protein